MRTVAGTKPSSEQTGRPNLRVPSRAWVAAILLHPFGHAAPTRCGRGQLSVRGLRLALKYLVECVVLATLLTHPTVAQVLQHGTYFIAAYSSPNHLIVSIDSRETAKGGNVNDGYCKIRPLSPEIFFFATGSTSGTSDQAHVRFFDAWDVANEVYLQVGMGTTRFDDLARAWATKVMEVYS